MKTAFISIKNTSYCIYVSCTKNVIMLIINELQFGVGDMTKFLYHDLSNFI